LPDVVARLTVRLAAYQATAVQKGFHQLKGLECSAPSPKDHPEWGGVWQPNCKGVKDSSSSSSPSAAVAAAAVAAASAGRK
jgi:hypothetical protein